MKRVASILVVGLVLGLGVGPVPVALASMPASPLVIASVYFGSPTDASDEFVVMHNQTAEVINLKGYELDYKAATGKSWYKKALAETDVQIAPHADLILATKREHTVELTTGMAQSGGNLRLVDEQDNVLDQLAWGNGDSPEGQAAKAVKPGEALSRQCDESSCSDTGNNQVDWSAVSIDASSGDSGAGASTSEPPNAASEDAQVEITELLPDPVSPQTDSKDEFVELYNAGLEAVNLTGWKLVDAAGHAAKLDGISIDGGSYLALYSATTKLSLNNDGDTVSLMRPSGEMVMTTPNYGAAKAGKSFGATTSGWGWLNDATPGAPNAALLVIEETSSSATTKAKKVTPSKSTKVAKAKATSAKSPKLAKTATAAKDAATTSSAAEDQQNAVPWTWLLATVGLFAVGYGVYEYRPEILSFFDRLRAKFAARR